MMKSFNSVKNSLYIAWVIALKDIVDALKNKNTCINILLGLGFVVFFYWGSNVRPWDKNARVVVYDEGKSSLEWSTIKLADDSEYTFQQVSSLQEMQNKMANQELGLVIPADFEQVLAAGGEPVLTGMIFWRQRIQSAELATKYTKAFSEIVGKPVQVQISPDFIIPGSNSDGDQASAGFNILFWPFLICLQLMPALINEERQTRTLDALMISPASEGQIVLGKAIAGLFYFTLAGGLSLALHWAFVVNWGLTLLAFGCCALFAIGVPLALASFISSPQQLILWIFLPLLLIVPSFFYMESNLNTTVRTVLALLPASPLANLYRFSFSSGVTADQVFRSLVLTWIYSGVLFSLVIWKLRRSGR
jgi:ABC-2 type transport system permease protein